MKKFLLLLLITIGAQQLKAFTVSITSTNVSCNAGCDGTATATATGGTAPYQYSWSNAATTQMLTNLCAGPYTVTVTDATLATATASITILQPTPVTVNFTSTTNCSCYGICDGSTTGSVTGGYAPYTYLWNNGPMTPTASNLCAGSYSVTITDANGCVATNSVTITEPPYLVLTITPANATICAGSSITLNAAGAMTYSWSIVNLTGSSITITPTVSATYTLTGMDPNGCYGNAVTTVIVDPLPTATSTSIEAGCNMSDGSGTVTPSGNSPFIYNWIPAGGNNATATGLPPGVYSVQVTDVNGCAIYVPVTVNDSCDFVWPGDANDDAIADNLDILDIGIANGATGSTRANASLNWIGQPSAVWGQTLLSGTDYKFVDCNGDGSINPADTNAVVQNLGFTHNNRQGGIPVYNSSLPDLTITLGQNTLASNSAGTMTIGFGSSAVPVANFYGLAFTLNFDPAQIDASTFRMNENGTWMGIPGTDLMGVVMNEGNGTGAVQVALTRLNHVNTNGFGNIANLGFMTTGDLVGTGNTQNVNFTITNVTVIDANENPQSVNTINDSLIVSDPVLTGISEVENAQQLSAYPNPFTGSVKIILPASSKGTNCELILTDAAGRIVLTQQTNGAETVILERGGLEQGIYFCSIRSNSQIAGTTKLIVN